MQFWTEGLDGVILSRGMHAVREEDDFYFTDETEASLHYRKVINRNRSKPYLLKALPRLFILQPTGMAPTKGELILWDSHFFETPWGSSINGLIDCRHSLSNARPTSGRQHDDGNSPPSEVVLIAEVLVGGDKNLKALLLCHGQQLAVRQLLQPRSKAVSTW